MRNKAADGLKDEAAPRSKRQSGCQPDTMEEPKGTNKPRPRPTHTHTHTYASCEQLLVSTSTPITSTCNRPNPRSSGPQPHTNPYLCEQLLVPNQRIQLQPELSQRRLKRSVGRRQHGDSSLGVAGGRQDVGRRAHGRDQQRQLEGGGTLVNAKWVRVLQKELLRRCVSSMKTYGWAVAGTTECLTSGMVLPQSGL
eukprot:365225-Chlamydomonas_euryale.AAC.7